MYKFTRLLYQALWIRSCGDVTGTLCIRIAALPGGQWTIKLSVDVGIVVFIPNKRSDQAACRATPNSSSPPSSNLPGSSSTVGTGPKIYPWPCWFSRFVYAFWQQREEWCCCSCHWRAPPLHHYYQAGYSSDGPSASVSSRFDMTSFEG